MGVTNFIKGRLMQEGTGTLPVMVKLTKKDKWRIAGGMFAGKMIGLFLVLVAIGFMPAIILGTPAHAQTPAWTAHETTLVNTANTIWTLVAAFLVFGMQPGFVFLEAGFARKRETVNVLMECIFDTCICGILFWGGRLCFHVRSGQWLHRMGRWSTCRRRPQTLVLSPKHS